MTKPGPSHNLLYLMLRAQQLAKQESSDGGYVMVVVSILTVMIFSLLAASLMVTNISKSATNAYIEGNSTFYAAESGLNKRAEEVRQKFLNYARPSGISPGLVTGQPITVDNMAACLDGPAANDGDGDFACRSIPLEYRQMSNWDLRTGADGKSSELTERNSSIKYNAYSFVVDRTNYADPVRKIPVTQPIPSGQAYEGMNALEYRYTVYSTATSKQAGNLDARATTVLEMNFKSRLIPLFQFAAFYDGDLEMNSTSPMDINGRLHTNGMLYAQPTPIDKKALAGSASTRLLGSVTVSERIFNRVDASSIKRFGDTSVLITGDPNNPNATTNVYKLFPEYNTDRTTPLTPAEIAEFQGKVRDGLAGAKELTVPLPGFLRKRDKDNQLGDYYAKADLRLEMVPKRAVGNVPFNFTAIKDGGSGGSCSGFELSPSRQGSNLKCSQLNEGQLRSLQQPVMVKVISDEERTRFCPSLTTNYNSSSGGDSKLLRSLQVAIASQNTPIPWSQLSLPLSNAANTNISTIVTGLNSVDTTKSPIQLAAEKGGCFFPAPIQVVTGSGTNDNTSYNWQSGYYDRREARWLGMLQTNLESLTIWNRDGVAVSRDNDLTTNDLPAAAALTTAFNDGDPSSTADTQDLLFIRAAADSTAPTGSFQKLGFAATDRSEGGLVFYATVSDDLDGNGTADITIDTADNLRNYPGGKKKSPYGFAVTGGKNLPGPLTVVTDQGLYAQGDYNTFSSNTAKQPAALIGDTVTNLSNSCLNSTTTRVNCGILSGQNAATVTTVNAAFLAYTEESVGNIIDIGNGNWGWGQLKKRLYSGGLNNYMRMVENWSGINFNYRGSFVSLGTPQEFSGVYQSGGGGSAYYNVPNRNFSYETDFNAFDRLPPLTPMVTYLQQDVFKRTY